MSKNIQSTETIGFFYSIAEPKNDQLDETDQKTHDLFKKNRSSPDESYRLNVSPDLESSVRNSSRNIDNPLLLNPEFQNREGIQRPKTAALSLRSKSKTLYSKDDFTETPK